MRVDFTAPDVKRAKNTEEAIDIIDKWCRDCTEKLNRILGSLGEENLSPALRDKILK